MLVHNKKSTLTLLLILSCLLICTLAKTTRQMERESSSYSSKLQRSSSFSFWGVIFAIFNFCVAFLGYCIAGCCCCCCACCWCLKKVGERNPQRLQDMLRFIQNKQRQLERRGDRQRQRERQKPLPSASLPQISTNFNIQLKVTRMNKYGERLEVSRRHSKTTALFVSKKNPRYSSSADISSIESAAFRP